MFEIKHINHRQKKVWFYFAYFTNYLFYNIMSFFSSIIYRYFAEYKSLLTLLIVKSISNNKTIDSDFLFWYNIKKFKWGENKYEYVSDYSHKADINRPCGGFHSVFGADGGH